MAAKHLHRIAFLFGAGISIRAKMPETAEITKRVLSCNNIGRASDGSYYLNYANGLSPQYIKRIKVMIELLNEELSRFYSARQVDGASLGGYERAGIASDQEANEMFLLARKIRDHVAAWLHKTHPELMVDQ